MGNFLNKYCLLTARLLFRDYGRIDEKYQRIMDYIIDNPLKWKNDNHLM